MKIRPVRLLALSAALLLLCAPALAESAQTPPDIAYLLALQQFRQGAGDALTAVMKGFTALGESAVPLILGALLFWVLDKRLGVYLFFSNAIGHLVNQAMKITACVYRPWVRDARIIPADGAKTTATGYSFPSGHVVNSGAALCTLPRYLRTRTKKRGLQRALTAVFAVAWLLVGFSRNFLGVHTPQDVAVMLVLMVLLLLGTDKLLKMLSDHPERDAAVAVSFALLGAALAVYGALKPYPMDYVDGALLVDPQKMAQDSFSSAGMMVGWSIGWLLERRLVRFDLDVKPAAKLLRLLVGVGGMLLIYLKLGKLLTSAIGGLWGSFAMALVLMLYITVVHPACFMLWEKGWARTEKPSAAA